MFSFFCKVVSTSLLNFLKKMTQWPLFIKTGYMKTTACGLLKGIKCRACSKREKRQGLTGYQCPALQ